MRTQDGFNFVLQQFGFIVCRKLHANTLRSVVGGEWWGNPGHFALDRDADTLSAYPTTSVARVTTPDSLAYVLFTSGSTGVPKGVAVTHANAVHYARSVTAVLTASAGPATSLGMTADGWHYGLASTLGADLGNTSLLPALVGGGTLHVLPKDVTTEPALFAEYVAAHPLDVLKITPNHLMALVAGKSGADLARVLPRKWVLLGGEALRLDVARTLLSAGTCRVLNHYGPTETTVGVLTFEATAATLRDGTPAPGPAEIRLASTRAFPPHSAAPPARGVCCSPPRSSHSLPRSLAPPIRPDRASHRGPRPPTARRWTRLMIARN